MFEILCQNSYLLAVSQRQDNLGNGIVVGRRNIDDITVINDLAVGANSPAPHEFRAGSNVDVEGYIMSSIPLVKVVNFTGLAYRVPQSVVELQAVILFGKLLAVRNLISEDIFSVTAK